MTFLMCGATGCSDSAPSPYPERQEVVLRAYSGSLAGNDALADSVCFARGSESGNYTEVWKAFVGTDGRAALKEAKYYPADDSPVFLRGFAPEGEPAGTGLVRYRIDGRQDILLTAEQSGSLTDMFWQESKSFEFAHLLSQLRFRVCCDESGAGKGWRLTRLLAEGVQGEAVLSLKEQTLSFSGEKGEVAVDMDALPLDLQWGDVGGVVMIQPGVPVSLTAVVVDSRGSLTRFEHLPVTFHEAEGYPVGGTSYLLSVTLRGAGGCSLSAQVAKWKRGNNGTGIID